MEKTNQEPNETSGGSLDDQGIQSKDSSISDRKRYRGKHNPIISIRDLLTDNPEEELEAPDSQKQSNPQIASADMPTPSVSTQQHQQEEPPSVEAPRTCLHQIIEFLNSISVEFEITDNKLNIVHEDFSIMQECLEYINRFISIKKVTTDTNSSGNKTTYYLRYQCNDNDPCLIKISKIFTNQEYTFCINLYINELHDHYLGITANDTKTRKLHEKLILVRTITYDQIECLHKGKTDTDSYSKKLQRQRERNRAKTRANKTTLQLKLELLDSLKYLVHRLENEDGDKYKSLIDSTYVYIKALESSCGFDTETV
ncbi:hypothetical protein K6H10_004784 [Candida tropicalis]